MSRYEGHHDVSKRVIEILHSSVDDLELVCRTVFGAQSTDNEIAPLPYREVALPPKLRFGYYTSGNTLILCYLVNGDKP